MGVNITYEQPNNTRTHFLKKTKNNVRTASLQPPPPRHSFSRKGHHALAKKTGGTRLLNLSNSSSFSLPLSTSVLLKSLHHCLSCLPFLFFFSPYRDKKQAVSACRPVSSQSVTPLYYVCCTPAWEQINAADKWPVTPLWLWQTLHPIHSLLSSVNIFWQLYILTQSRVAGSYLWCGRKESDFPGLK